MRARRISFAPGRLMAVGLGAVVTAGLLAGPAISRPEEAESSDTPDHHEEPVTPVVPVSVSEPEPDRTAELSAVDAPSVAWPKPDSETVSLTIGQSAEGKGTRAGKHPIWLAVDPSDISADSAAVELDVATQSGASSDGADGLLLTMRPADPEIGDLSTTITVDYSAFEAAYGGDWAQRLRFVHVPDCRDCEPKTLPTAHDADASALSAKVKIDAGGTTLAVTAGASGPTGDYSATSLSPAGEWEVAPSSGAFTWSYPMAVPDVPGGLAPELGLSYSSASVDGRVVSTNNQTSVVGEGWADVGPGFIERSYRSCADDPSTPKTGDLCWVNENATMSFDGQSVELVRVGSTEIWRPKRDDGTRIVQRFDANNGDVRGEWWEVTTTDGVQYRFGSRPSAQSTWTVPVFGNSPGQGCGGSFATSSCARAWRWNLDYVVDLRKNEIKYQYAKETNKYDINLNWPPSRTAEYVRGGYLERIDYGTRAGESAPAQARVAFHLVERCRSGDTCAENKQNYPDTPLDLKCTSSTTCEGKVSPTFWTTKRLAGVMTRVLVNGEYKDVDHWTLEHEFPTPGDGTSPSLWLHKITHSGRVHGIESTPAVTFPARVTMNNRVNPTSDGRLPMARYRVTNIRNESGGEVVVRYADPNCSDNSRPDPATNKLRCFPIRWTPAGYSNPVVDYFHKYVVERVAETDHVGGNSTQVTTYAYDTTGGAAWRYDHNEVVPENRRTWSIWRGYEHVTVRHGDPAAGPVSETRYQYFRGMDGDRANSGTKSVSIRATEGDPITDRDQYAGLLREEITMNGSEVVSATIHDPWHRLTADRGRLKAFQVETGASRTRVALALNSWQRSSVEYTYDSDDGLLKRILDKADGTEDHCTKIEYVNNTTAWLIGFPKEQTVATTCSDSPAPDQLISATRTYYDNKAFGAAPSVGDPTKVEQLQHVPGGPATRWITTSQSTYDRYGRVVASTDALDRTTTVAYHPESGRPTRTTETNAMGHVTTTLIDPYRGQPTTVQRPNGGKTELAYDPLGRLIRVWLPGRTRSQEPNQRFSYGVGNDAASWVKSEVITANDTYVASYALFDGFLRERQTQSTPASGSGRVIADTFHDSRGLVSKVNHAYFDDAGPPGSTVLGVVDEDENIYRQTVNHYDGAGREVRSVYRSLGSNKWQTATTYRGNQIDVDPPDGATPTTTKRDARGRTVELHHYHGGAPTGRSDVTRYSHTPAGHVKSITGPDLARWVYVYDLLGRMVSASDPDKGETSMTYDDAGQLLTRTDSRGTTLAHSYDDLGRKTATYEGSLEGSLLAEWEYDTLPDGSRAAVGMLTKTIRHYDDQEFTTTIDSVDSAGRPTSTSVNIPENEDIGELAGEYQTRFTYRSDGSLHSTNLPAVGDDLRRERISHSYNNAGLPLTTTGLLDYVINTVYTPQGEVSEMQVSAASGLIKQSRTRDLSTRRLVRNLIQRRSGSHDASIEDYHYGHDSAGNVTRIADLPFGASADVQCFTYDHVNRLTEAWTPADGDCGTEPAQSTLGGIAPYWTSYAYSPGGNRTMEMRHATTPGGADTTVNYDYPGVEDGQPHALRSITSTGPVATQTQSYDYDTAGNTTSAGSASGTQAIEWNAEGRIDSITGDQATTRFIYDANGGRLVRIEPNSTTLYLGNQEVTLDRASNVATGTRYYSHAGETTAVRSSGTVTALTGDHHNTATTALDFASGQVTRRRFDPFGNARGPQPSAWPGDKGFVGGIHDASTGLVHLGAREYDPTTGRFISVDPILNPSDPQQMNGYSYSNNNPTTLTDPTGLAPTCGGAVDGAGCGYVKNGAANSKTSAGGRVPKVDNNPYPSGNPRSTKPSPRRTASAADWRAAEARSWRAHQANLLRVDRSARNPQCPDGDCSFILTRPACGAPGPNDRPGHGGSGDISWSCYHDWQEFRRKKRILDGNTIVHGGLCVSAYAALAIGFSVKYCHVTDDYGSGHLLSFDVGVLSQVGAGVNPSFVGSNSASSIEDLKGEWGHSVGVGTPYGGYSVDNQGNFDVAFPGLGARLRLPISDDKLIDPTSPLDPSLTWSPTWVWRSGYKDR